MRYIPVLYFFLSMTVSCHRSTLFERITADHSGINFSNTITETDSITPFSHINIYNGGGVGIGDFNNDGKQDIYFTGNMVPCRLYLNQGNFVFDDITAKSGAAGEKKWCKGVSVVDINNDGWQDLYISVSMDADSMKRANLLYINQGNDKDGIPHFKEEAAAWGLDDKSHSTTSLFFDYDNDGDLDLYIVVNENIRTQNPSKFRPIKNDGSHPSTGRLYRNDWNNALGHGVFTNVSRQAGVTIEGYGHGGIVCDINKDGWQDVYITNDFISSNILYINNHNGTFTDRSKEYFKHTSTFAMGVDMEDINNDGLTDIIELDMNPEDNFRKKMMLGANNYQTFQGFDRYGYQYQYSRNTLQLNQGPRRGHGDSMGDPVFSEIGYLSGMSETDWSWTPIVTDFDNDGFRDIIITNGYPRDVTDHDFMNYRAETRKLLPPLEALQQVPQVKLHNYAFHNNGDLTFTNKTFPWGFDILSFSGGGAYADLDNDGDMDVVISNINEAAFVYKNNTMERTADFPAGYLQVSFEGDSANRNGFGAAVHLYYDHGKQQVYEQTPFRGYLSSVQNIGHFGLGNINLVDSLVVIWPDGKTQVLLNVKPNQSLKLRYADAHQPGRWETVAPEELFTAVTGETGIRYVHTAVDFVDFNIQKLLPHKFSEYTPALASGDINGDGTDDIICGGNSGSPAQVFLQQKDGKFVQRAFIDTLHSYTDDAGLLLFDADGDGDLDVYVSSGGYRYEHASTVYQDHLYINDGRGVFAEGKNSLPQNFVSKGCVRAADFDRDGDLDLFVAGRVDPWNYPKPVTSVIYRNDSKDGKITFTDVTSTVAKGLIDVGMICDALFTDFDNDGWPDIVAAGEWMPVRFFKNEKGFFRDISAGTGVNDLHGWWNGIAPGDFDNDGDTDYIIGNLGLNSFFKASDQYPVYITAKDFDGNGSYDAFPSLFLPTSHADTQRKEYPAHLKDDALSQVISLKIKYLRYLPYAGATMNDLFTTDQMKGAQRLRVNELASCYFRNDGKGKFTCTRLPPEAQFAPLGAASVHDFDGDGNQDVLLTGNDFGTDVSVGRYDAFNGLVLKGDGKGHFKPMSIQESGIYIPGNAKAMVCLESAANKLSIAVSQNKGPLLLFSLNAANRTVRIKTNDVSVLVTGGDGSRQKTELYYGNGFLSQSARRFFVSGRESSLQIINNKGEKRDGLLPSQ